MFQPIGARVMGCKHVVRSNKAVGYIRVSTVQQAANGESLDSQRASIEAWCASRGYELVSVHTDAGISGGKMTNRPGLTAAKQAAMELHGVFVVYSLSRLGRTLEGMLSFTRELRKAKVDLVSITENIDMTTATGELFFNLLVSVGQFQRQITSELTAAAAAHKISQGRWIGGDTAYGYQRDGEFLVENPDEQQIIAFIKEQRASGVSIRNIPKRLSQRGYYTREGTPFSPTQIVRILGRIDR